MNSHYARQVRTEPCSTPRLEHWGHIGRAVGVDRRVGPMAHLAMSHPAFMRPGNAGSGSGRAEQGSLGGAQRVAQLGSVVDLPSAAATRHQAICWPGGWPTGSAVG
jgi:hypothetical protein